MLIFYYKNYYLINNINNLSTFFIDMIKNFRLNIIAKNIEIKIIEISNFLFNQFPVFR